MVQPFILASASPRRRQLLEQAGLQCVVCARDIDETPARNEPALTYVQRVAVAKALALDAASLLSCRREAQAQNLDLGVTPLVLAADTVVHIAEQLFGKPGDADMARQTLAQLAHHWHLVTTGVAFVQGHKIVEFLTVTTQVRFRNLTAAEIDRYVASGEPFDKAGGYGIQGLGGFLIDELKGSYTNVVGLPLAQVFDVLQRLKTGDRDDAGR